MVDGVTMVYDAFEFTDATKEHHCYSWMYAEVLGKFACLGSHAHVAAGGQQMRMLEIGCDFALLIYLCLFKLLSCFLLFRSLYFLSSVVC